MPLSTKGRYIVNACGERFKLKSVNWYGASGQREVVGGLQYRRLEEIVALIRQAGFNSVRLPFSNQMLHTTTPVNPEYLSANPELLGTTPLEVFDAVVQALSEQHIVIILNNHTSFSEWCCGFDSNGLWYHSGQSTEQWQQDWLNLLARYADIPEVAGVDLRNEVRTTRWQNIPVPESPNWGWGNQNDWRLVAQQTGNLIHAQFEDLLIIVEGINWWGSLPILGSGERPHLKPVEQVPINLMQANKLVYAAHNYGFIGPNHNGDDSTSAGNIKYSDMDRDTLREVLDQEFGFVIEADHPYTAPVWVSEFGAAHSELDENYKNWLAYLVDYLIEKDLDFAYWPLNPEKGDGSIDTFGLVTENWQRLREDWRSPLMQRLLTSDGYTGVVTQEDFDFSIISFNDYDDNVSTIAEDWDPGAYKASCRDGDRVIGLSGNFKALCTQAQFVYLWNRQDFYTVNSEVPSPRAEYLPYDDWASGFTKYECDLNHYVAGVSKRWWGTSGVLCAKANQVLGNQCQTLWFDNGDHRDSTKAGDWAQGSYKGQCGDGTYVAGVAQRDGNASALLCCQ